MNKVASHYLNIGAFELIAQDTTSTATKSKIQIPSQNVVSYGKKFTVPATAQHYDPFNGFTSGNLASVQALIDTDTSLGLANWLHSGSYYRPYNGARVVRWVNSSGVIKTSVNVMPPNARSYANSASLTNATAKANASIANNTFYPTIEAGTIDHSQSEVAKTFHWREIGNGAARQGSNTSGTLQDSSMLNAVDTIAYIMDDGLTSVSAANAITSSNAFMSWSSSPDDRYLTFIGTGLSIVSGYDTGTSAVKDNIQHVVQNLPYGTHILSKSSSTHKTLIDGIELTQANSNLNYWKEYTFHQPKMPPIPEDAVVISDYMLMADFVSIPNGTAINKAKIAKGVRRISPTRDIFYNSGASFTFDNGSAASVEISSDGKRVYNNNASTVYQLPYFGTDCVFLSGVASDRAPSAQFKINGTLVTTSSSGTNHSGTQVLNSWTTGSGSFQTDNDGSFTMVGSSRKVGQVFLVLF